jgi:diaminopimelate epimerase
MKKFYFIKMSGAGNDFILFDRNTNPALNLSEQSIKKLCSRRNGIGADGVILISDSREHDFDMNYYNADGSEGSLCGNGARCAIKFALKSGRTKNGKSHFISNNQSYSGEIVDNKNVKFYLNSPSNLSTGLTVEAFGQQINYSFADTGSPHVVINIKDVLQNASETGSSFFNIKEIPVVKIGREIRYHKDFLPGGVNVNFIQIKDNDLFIRTYERGVENETLACGTGSVAATLIGNINYGLKPPVKLFTYGEDTLVVDFINKDGKFNNISLTGPAKVVFEGEILAEDFF